MNCFFMYWFIYCLEYYLYDVDCDLIFFIRCVVDCVIIGYDVWIGYGVIVLFGVKIGNGVVLVVGVVVSKDVVFYIVVGGVLVKFIWKCFEFVIVLKFIDIVWWDWFFVIIIECFLDFQLENINVFCDCWWGKNVNENGNS